MNADRIELLGEDLRQYVFHMLDAEPDMDGMEAGRVAAEVEHAFYAAMLRLDDLALVPR